MKMTVRFIDFAKHGAPSKSNCIGLKFVLLLNFHSKLKQNIRIKRSGIICCCCCCNAEVYRQQKKRKKRSPSLVMWHVKHLNFSPFDQCYLLTHVLTLVLNMFYCLTQFQMWFSSSALFFRRRIIFCSSDIIRSLFSAFWFAKCRWHICK